MIHEDFIARLEGYWQKELGRSTGIVPLESLAVHGTPTGYYIFWVGGNLPLFPQNIGHLQIGKRIYDSRWRT